ncbi:hypothetical protein QTP86_002040 [Hemibagrus guttatus]|nr:hypothetical protein QTP86_002040 [Hemibagrus guttatus]
MSKDTRCCLPASLICSDMNIEVNNQQDQLVFEENTTEKLLAIEHAGIAGKDPRRIKYGGGPYSNSGGKGYKAILKELDVPVSTVQSIIKKFKMFNTVKNLDGRGRKRKVSSRVARKICRDANNPRITTKALIDTLNQARKTVSRSTVQ